MDSERKHELETNDLREFLDNFKDFWDKHGNKILLLLILVLGGIAIYNGYHQWKDKAADEAQTQLASATTAQQLRDVADEYPLVHDEAMRRAGDLYFAEARNAVIDGDPQAAEDALKNAESAYTALTNRGKSTEFKLVGHEGLAKVAIMSGAWDEAKSHYEQMIELAGDAFLATTQRAETGLVRLELLQNPIAFAEGDDLTFIPDDEALLPIPEDAGDVVDPVQPILPESLTPETDSPSE